MVAMIDTAVDATHPELIGAIAGIFDAVEAGSAPAEPHGTEIAGILVAHARLIGGCARGQAAQRARLPRWQSRCGAIDLAATAEGDRLGFHAGAKVMNMSFTGPTDPLLERVLKAAAGEGRDLHRCGRKQRS